MKFEFIHPLLAHVCLLSWCESAARVQRNCVAWLLRIVTCCVWNCNWFIFLPSSEFDSEIVYSTYFSFYLLSVVIMFVEYSDDPSPSSLCIIGCTPNNRSTNITSIYVALLLDRDGINNALQPFTWSILACHLLPHHSVLPAKIGCGNLGCFCCGAVIFWTEYHFISHIKPYLSLYRV